MHWKLTNVLLVLVTNSFFLKFVTGNEILEEKHPIVEQQGNDDTQPQLKNEGTKAEVELPAVEHEPAAAVSEKGEAKDPSGLEEESEEDSDEETDSEGYTSESESSQSHTDHSASDKEVCCFKDIIRDLQCTVKL